AGIARVAGGDGVSADGEARGRARRGPAVAGTGERDRAAAGNRVAVVGEADVAGGSGAVDRRGQRDARAHLRRIERARERGRGRRRATGSAGRGPGFDLGDVGAGAAGGGDVDADAVGGIGGEGDGALDQSVVADGGEVDPVRPVPTLHREGGDAVGGKGGGVGGLDRLGVEVLQRIDDHPI